MKSVKFLNSPKLTIVVMLALGWLMLTACAPSPAQIDPYSLEAQAQSVVNQAQAMQTATSQAVRLQADAEIAAIAGTQAAQSNLATLGAQVANATATQQALEIWRDATTATAQAESAQATAAADKATTTAVAQATEAAHMAYMNNIEAQRAQAQLERERIYRAVGWALLIGLVIMAVLLAWRYVETMRRASAKKGSIYETKDGSLVLVDQGEQMTLALPAKSFGSVVHMDGAQTVTPSQVSDWLQALTTLNAQQIQAIRATVGGNFAPYPEVRSMPARGQTALPTGVSMETPPLAQLPTRAEWGQFCDWQGLGVPLGLGAEGRLLTAHPDEYPHRLFAGATGSGKSRLGLRPFLAGALARGWQIVAIGDVPLVDFLPFKTHPNFHSLLLDDPSAVLPLLVAIIAEIRRRLGVLEAAGVTTWGRLARADDPRVVVAFDEFSALADGLERDKSKFFGQVAQVARLGRKAGVHLACGVQNPTRENIRPSIKRNMTPVAFRVLDDVASRVIIDAGGAQELGQGQFIARLTQNTPGVGFSPSDVDIEQYLNAHSPQVWRAPDWLPIEGASGQTAHEGVDTRAEQARTLHAQGMSLNEIQRALFGYTGGAAYETVKMAIG